MDRANSGLKRSKSELSRSNAAVTADAEEQASLPGEIPWPAPAHASLSHGTFATRLEDRFHDLLSREALRDEKVLAMQQQLAQLQEVFTSLVARPGVIHAQHQDDCSEHSSTSPRGCWGSSRSVHISRESSSGVTGGFSKPRTSFALADGTAGSRYRGPPSDDSESENEWEPPTTMYAYCVYWISCSDDLWSLKEAWYLLLMLACQVILVFSFSVSMSLNALNEHMATFYDSSVKELECLYWPMTFHHRPLLFIASVVTSTLVVLCYMKIKDRDTMLTFYLEPRSRCAKWLVSYAWFVQAIWLPCMFCGCTANLLWSSETTRHVIMNSVSLAFLLELDGYMFAAFISDENKNAYMKESSMAHKSIDFSQVHSAQWSLYRVGCMQCIVLSLIYHYLNWFSVVGLVYDWSLWFTCIVYMVVYAARACLIQCMGPDDVSGETFVMSNCRLSLTSSSILGIGHFVVMMFLWSPKSVYPPLTVACAQEFQG